MDASRQCLKPWDATLTDELLRYFKRRGGRAQLNFPIRATRMLTVAYFPLSSSLVRVITCT